MVWKTLLHRACADVVTGQNWARMMEQVLLHFSLWFENTQDCWCSANLKGWKEGRLRKRHGECNYCNSAPMILMQWQNAHILCICLCRCVFGLHSCISLIRSTIDQIHSRSYILHNWSGLLQYIRSTAAHIRPLDRHPTSASEGFVCSDIGYDITIFGEKSFHPIYIQEKKKRSQRKVVQKINHIYKSSDI